jgi:6-phosphogluconolactonase (cycloisomerase 2 family)
MSNTQRRRFSFQLAGLTLALAAAIPAFAHEENSFREGKVFTSTNATGGNELLVFAPARGGDLALVERIATNGQGTGAALGSQSAVTLSSDGRHAFVVNAASSTVSTFAIRDNGVVLSSVIDSGGLTPISVTEYDGIVYVLNAGGAGNVAGFRNVQGQLRPIANSLRGLSAAGGTGPAQVGFGAEGDVLVVTEKVTSRITSFPVRRDGTLGTVVLTPATGANPVGVAVDRRDNQVVCGGAGPAASSYRFSEGSATPVLITGSLPNTQAAACWLAVTPNGRYAFTANAGSSSVSTYSVTRTGQLALVSPVAGITGPNAGALDLAVSPDGHRLFALAPRSLQVVSFKVEFDGGLTRLGTGGGLPAGSAGLAAN